jgi:hypothetical protein
MEEDNWIDMIGILLIATEGAATEGIIREEGAKGGGVEVGLGDKTEQGTEAERDEGVEHTDPTEENRASDVERVAVAEHVVPTADASPGIDAANIEGAAHVSAE